MRLIDADALLANIKGVPQLTNCIYPPDVYDLITNAPTVQREVPDRIRSIKIPTDTMEQEFQSYYRRGYEAGKKAVQREEVNVDEMVNRFLGWKLPKDFTPDCGIEFDADKYANHKFEPIGTNLFNAPQAKAMIEYMLSAAPKE